MYRNIYYNPGDSHVTLFTWDDQGTRIQRQVEYNPYLYYETSSDDYDGISLLETKLRKKYFSNQYDRVNFKKSYDNNRLFGDISCEQQFLIDYYYGQNESPEFSKFNIRYLFIDIETYSPGEFPIPRFCKDPINIITVYDSLEKEYTSWGTKPCETEWIDTEIKKAENKPVTWNYVYCKDEETLLDNFLTFIELSGPDIISGWNSDKFDIPYIIYRSEKILGDNASMRLSPVRKLYSRELRDDFGNIAEIFDIKGTSSLDYLNIYKKYSIGERESYKLDFIGEHENVGRKINFVQGNLSKLADEDWNKFVWYNVMDVILLEKLDNKLRYLELVRMIAYTGLSPFPMSLGTIGVNTGIATIFARKEDRIIPTFIKGDVIRDYPGGYVRNPKTGDFQEYLASFDANSLYPNTVISLNMSPETKLGRIIKDTATQIRVISVKGKTKDFTPDEFNQFIRDHKIAVSEHGVLFNQKYKGLFPSIMDTIYQQRVEVKNKMKKIDDPDELEYLDILQYTLKILINSMYGAFANKYFAMFDVDIAASITKTGQAVIKQAQLVAQQYVYDYCGIKSPEEMEDKDPIVYGDTDSLYLTIDSMLKHKNVSFLDDDGGVSPQAYEMIDEIDKAINVGVSEWATNSRINSIDSRFVFKREIIAESGIFIAKKRYALRVLDNEGKKGVKYKYTGVEIVRSTIPNTIKPFLRDIVETMLTTRDKSRSDSVYLKSYQSMCEMDLHDYSMVRGIKNYEKYADQCMGFNLPRAMPIHSKAAYFYNMMLDEHNLTSQYEYISSGDKVRFYYVQLPNDYDFKVIGYKDNIPDKFHELFVPDVDFMFEKLVHIVIGRFYEAVGWNLQKPNLQFEGDIFDVL